MQNKTALLVDDNRQNLIILQEELVRLGFTVSAINDPSRVEAQLASMKKVDIIFLDLEMSPMDGYAVLATLREHGINVPIVAHTVHTNELSKMRQVGFNGLVPKPLDIDNFPAAVQKLLDGKTIWLTS